MEEVTRQTGPSAHLCLNRGVVERVSRQFCTKPIGHPLEYVVNHNKLAGNMRETNKYRGIWVERHI